MRWLILGSFLVFVAWPAYAQSSKCAGDAWQYYRLDERGDWRRADQEAFQRASEQRHKCQEQELAAREAEDARDRIERRTKEITRDFIQEGAKTAVTNVIKRSVNDRLGFDALQTSSSSDIFSNALASLEREAGISAAGPEPEDPTLELADRILQRGYSAADPMSRQAGETSSRAALRVGGRAVSSLEDSLRELSPPPEWAEAAPTNLAENAMPDPGAGWAAESRPQSFDSTLGQIREQAEAEAQEQERQRQVAARRKADWEAEVAAWKAHREKGLAEMRAYQASHPDEDEYDAVEARNGRRLQYTSPIPYSPTAAASGTNNRNRKSSQSDPAWKKRTGETVGYSRP